MEAFSAAVGQSKRYTLKGWSRALYLFFAIGGICLGVVLYSQTLNAAAKNPWPMRLSAAAVVLAGIYFGISAFSSFVQLDQQSVSVGGVLQTRSLRLDAIRGRRTISSRNGSYLVIEGKNREDRPLRISSSFDLDDDWAAWAESLVDLDEQDRQAVLDAVASDAELGSTPEERLGKLRQAKTIAIALSVVAIAAAAALWIAGHSISLNLFGAIDLLLVVLPWVALLLQARSPLLYSVVANKKDPRATLLFVPLAAGFGLLASPFSNLQSVSPMTLLGYGCIPGVILAFAFYGASRPGPQEKRVAALLVLLFLAGFYGDGLATQINTQLDRSAPRPYTAQVLQKTYSSGRSTTYYLHLSSWETPGEEEKVTVSSSLYESVQEGDSVCVTARDGALQVGWFTVQRCD
jgi:hypothetical protein